MPRAMTAVFVGVTKKNGKEKEWIPACAGMTKNRKGEKKKKERKHGRDAHATHGQDAHATLAAWAGLDILAGDMSKVSENSSVGSGLGSGPGSGSSLAGLRVTVVGLGRFGGGLGAASWLCGQGARVTVSDMARADSLGDSVRQLAELGAELHLGSHERADFLQADLLVVNPAVPKDMPLLVEAERAGVGRTSEINLFLQRCPAPVVGITGSVGKSTTTVMVGEILGTSRAVHVGGNIGKSLLGELPAIKPSHAVVLELSSFQLEDTPIVGISPAVALVTNVFENHLDRYAGSLQAYADAKKNIFRFQGPDDVLILNRRCELTAGWAAETPSRVDWFDPQAEPVELALPGQHNQANAQGALAVAKHFDIDRPEALAALARVRSLPHRLEFVGEIDGVRFFNDSKCTTPAGAVVALESFQPGRCVILMGGYDKAVNFDALGAKAAGQAKGVVAFGQTGGAIISAVRRNAKPGQAPALAEAADLSEAVKVAKTLAKPGDVILLSPACASYDQFDNYQRRGEMFAELVL